MRIFLYILGALLVAGGGAWIALSLGVPPTWVAVGCVIIIGLSIMGAASSARSTHVDVHRDGHL